MRTRAKRTVDEWVINGTKMWITNGSVADIAIVWAQTDEGIKGFLVPTDTPGFSAPKISKKLSLRASITSELVLEDVHLPPDSVLPGGNRSAWAALLSQRGPLRHRLRCPRRGAGLSGGSDRVRGFRARSSNAHLPRFSSPRPSLADMTLELQKGFLLALHLGRLKDDHRLQSQQVSLGKLNNVREALSIARECRAILGANGITLEYPVLRHANNLESVLTYEGTSEVHQLVIGQALTGENAFG
jgi:glutaryl-CoA dehydrogenase